MPAIGQLFADATDADPGMLFGGLVLCWLLGCLVWRCVVAALLERPARFRIDPGHSPHKGPHR